MRPNYRRGMALVLALLTSLAVLIMGETFLGLALLNSRSATGQRYNIQAVELANAGLQFALNYMGEPEHWGNYGGVETLTANTGDWGGTNIEAVQDGLKVTLRNTQPFILESGVSQGLWSIRISPNVGNPAAGQPATYFIEVYANLQNDTGESVAGRTVQATVKDLSVTDYAIFEQNCRAWDVPGAPLPNAEQGTDDCIGITDGYEMRGAVCVDGSPESDAAYQTSGNLNIWGTDIKFLGPVSIHSNSNVYHVPTSTDVNALNRKIFPVSLRKGVPSRGELPGEDFLTRESEPGTAESLAAGAGVSNPGYCIFDDADITYDAANPKVPNIPVLRLNFNSDATVTMQKLRRNNLGQLEVYQNLGSVALKDIPQGIIYVKGGNVQVRGTVKGKITVVADENPSRNIYDATLTEPSFYDGRWHWPQTFDFVKREGNLSIIGDLTYGSGFDNIAGMVAKNYLYLNDYGYNPATDAGRTLEVNGVLMSYNHSLQFDWDNFSRNAFGINNTNINTPEHFFYFRNNYKNGVFKLNGSIISKYADVEGDIYGRGCPVQKIKHDDSLKNLLPPNFPQWAKAGGNPNIPIIFKLLNYEDMGSLRGKTAP